MKTGLVYIAIFVVLSFTLVFRSDYAGVELAELQLKNVTVETAAAAVLYVDEEEYAEGYLVFDDNEVLKVSEKLLGSRCDEYVINIFDDSLKHRQYDSKGGSSEVPFTFPDKFIDRQGMEVDIRKPGVIIEAKNNQEFYRLSELRNIKTNILRSTMYVMEGR